MALNEHDPNGPSGFLDQVEVDRLATATSALLVRARDALNANDPEAFAAVLAEVDGLGHRHRIHQARLRSSELAFANREGTPPAVVARELSAIAHALAGWLEQDSAEPTLLGYAGVACFELGLYKEAEALLEAAVRLNPQLPDIDKSLRNTRARRRAKATVPGIPADVRASFTKLRPRLAALAKHAKPAEGLTLSLCMIVRDEEEMLPRCLEAIKDGVDEMVIVDTGSRDRTIEIAESFGATVLHHTWTGDFGSARNVGMDAATGDWLIIVDADEVFVEDDARRLHELKGHTWREAFFLEEINHTGDMDDGMAAKHNALRMIRNRPEHRYLGTVHEQLAHQLPGFLPERLEYTDLRMDHFGYLGSVREGKDKSDRNLQLLLDQVAEGDDTPFVHFNLGSEYSGIEGESDRAIEHFRTAWQGVANDDNFTLYGFMPSLACRFARGLRWAERYEELDEVCAVIHEKFPGFTDVYFEQAIAALDQDRTDEGRALLERCLELGDAPARYSSTVGCGTFLPEMRLAQLELTEDKGDEAEARMRRIHETYPRFYSLIDPYVNVRLIRGASPDDVLAELTASEEFTPSGWFMVGINLQERGHYDQAEAAFRGALERRPTLDAARVALADALLVQGRVEEAAEQAEMVPVDTRHGGAAVRTALFARLALDEGDRLEEQRSVLVAQLASSNLAEDDQAVLRSWAAVRAGDASPRPALDREAINGITPMLDGLLRLGAADAFADLVAVMPDTGIDRRTQHEVMATLLLRRGLPDLAADEWIAAVNETGPDAAAFAGLAESARLRGLEEDARMLAAEALEMEAGHPLATRVLEAVGA